MTVLVAMRWALLGSIAVYTLGLLVGGEIGLLIGIVGSCATALSAIGCVLAKLVQWRRKRVGL